MNSDGRECGCALKGLLSDDASSAAVITTLQNLPIRFIFFMSIKQCETSYI